MNNMNTLIANLHNTICEPKKEIEALQKELDELKASIPHLISNAIYEALDKFGPTNGYHAIDLVDHLEEFADQLTSKE